MLVNTMTRDGSPALPMDAQGVLERFGVPPARIVDFLTQVSGQMQKMDEGLRSAGAPPVDGGQEKADKALTRLAGARKAVDKAATTLRGAKVTDEKSLQTALGSVAKVMVKYGEYQGPLQDLKAADPQLNIAFLAAPSCRGVS